MARKGCRAAATAEQTLTCVRTQCAGCNQPMWVAYHTQRTVTTLQGICRLTLCIRRCRNPQCEWYHRPYRPEEEGKWALPHGEFGLDVIALVGSLRYASHRSVPEIHQILSGIRSMWAHCYASQMQRVAPSLPQDCQVNASERQNRCSRNDAFRKGETRFIS